MNGRFSSPGMTFSRMTSHIGLAHRLSGPPQKFRFKVFVIGLLRRRAAPNPPSRWDRGKRICHTSKTVMARWKATSGTPVGSDDEIQVMLRRRYGYVQNGVQKGPGTV